MDTKSQKDKLREQLLKRRLELDEEEYLRRSARIVRSLQKQPEFQKAKTIHCYVSLNERREVNTRPLIRELLAGDKNVVVPITEFDSGRLKSVHLDSYSDLKKNKWGVLEPEGGRKAEKSEIDLVVVPMVGGDFNRNRIGYGKGFYDRFLSSLNVPAIGLLFNTCLLQEVPVEPFDVPLEKLITEEETI